MKIVLISTSNIARGRSALLEDMIASVERAAAGMPDADVRLLLLLQGCRGRSDGGCDDPEFVSTERIADVVSLSAARNLLLKKAFAERLIDDDTIVAFPDDDCWYPRDALKRIAGRFGDDPELDFWFCGYASTPSVPKEAAAFAGARPTTAQVVRNASSNTIVVRGRVARAIGRFDETLGVGTPNGAGEDLDFALHAFRLARCSVFVDAALVGHRDNNPELRSKYYRGSLIALGRHASLVRGAWFEYVRKIAIGAYLGARGELGVGAYVSALRASIARENRIPDLQANLA